MPVEIERTANRDGIVVVRGQDLALGTGVAGTRVTLRFDGGLIHASALRAVAVGVTCATLCGSDLIGERTRVMPDL